MANAKRTFRGVARNVEWREENNFPILTFRIEQTDDEGNVVNYTPAELRGMFVKGNLVDGDEVEATGEIDPEGILIPKRIINLRTKACIKYGPYKWNFIFVYAIISGIIGGIIGAIIGGIIGAIIGGIIGSTTGESGEVMVGILFGSAFGSVGISSLCGFVFILLGVSYGRKKYKEKYE
jgi:hypothetical protein